MRRGLQLRRASFYHGAKIRNSAVFAPRGKLVGECLPQTLLWRLKPLEKFPQILFGLFQKQFRYTPRFSPISERTPRTERRSTTYETI